MTKSKRNTNKSLSCQWCWNINNQLMVQCDRCQSRYHLKCLAITSTDKTVPFSCSVCVEENQFRREQSNCGYKSKSPHRKQMGTINLDTEEHYRSNYVRSKDHNSPDHHIQIHGSQIGPTKDHQSCEIHIDGRYNQFYRINSDQSLVNRSQDHRSQNSVSRHSRCGTSSVSRNHIARNRIEEERQLKEKLIEEEKRRKEKSDLDKIYRVLANNCNSGSDKRWINQRALVYMQADNLSLYCRNEFAKRISQIKSENTSTKGQQLMNLEPKIGLSSQSKTPKTPCQSRSALDAHPCPKDDASQHMFHGQQLRKFHESCQNLEQQVELSTKKAVSTESYKPRMDSKRHLGPAQDAKLHRFHGNEFKRAPECEAEIEYPKPKDNKSTVATAYELPKQINWIQRRRNQNQSSMISQEKPMFSNSIRKIGEESNFKMYETREFQESVDNQFNIMMSSINQWEPENQIFQRSMFGNRKNLNIQCRTDHQNEQTDKISIHFNQHEKIRVEVPASQQATRASTQSTNDSKIPRQLSDTKQHNIHQRQSMEVDKIESHKPKSENVLSEKSCRNENVVKDDLKQGSDICREMEKGRLIFDIPRKSNVWRVPENQEMINCSSTFDKTINSIDLESDRPKVENQRQGREFRQFEDHMPRHEVPVYTMYDQIMGFDIRKECIIEHQGHRELHQLHQCQEVEHSNLEINPQIYAVPLTANRQSNMNQILIPIPRQAVARYLIDNGTLTWIGKSDEWSKWHIMYSRVLKKEFQTAVLGTRLFTSGNRFKFGQVIKSDAWQNQYHREFSQLVSQRVGDDPGIMVVNEWQRSINMYGRQSNEIRNLGNQQLRNINELPQLIMKSTYGTTYCEYLSNQSLLNLFKWGMSRIQGQVPEILKIIKGISSRHEHKFSGPKVISVPKIILPSIVIPNRFSTWYKIVKSLIYVTRYVSISYSKGRKSTSPRTWQRLIVKAQLKELVQSCTSKISMEFTTEFEGISRTTEPLRRHNRLANSMLVEELIIQEKKDCASYKSEKSNLTLETIVLWYELTQTKSNDRKIVRYDSPIALIIWFEWLVLVPCHKIVIGQIENRLNLEIHQEHINKIHQGTEGYFSTEKLGVQAKYKMIEDHWTKRKRIKIDQKVEAEVFCSSIATKAKVAFLDYLSIPWKVLQEVVQKASLPTCQLFKVARWIIWSKAKTSLSWLKQSIIKWTKVSTFVLSNICSKSSIFPHVSQHMGGTLKKPTRSAKIISNGQIRRRMVWKPAAAVLDVSHKKDGLAQGLDRETGGSVRITANSTHQINEAALTCHKDFRTSRSAELKFEEMGEGKQANGRNVIIVKMFNKNSFSD